IYSSPLARCRDAAQILSAGQPLEPVTLDALRELDFGQVEGLTYTEIEQRYPELYRQWMERPTQVRFPGGESFGDMRTRVLRAVKGLVERHAGESIVLVTHAGVIRIVLADALGMEPDHIFRIGQRYGGISLIHYVDGVPVVELVNGTLRP